MGRFFIIVLAAVIGLIGGATGAYFGLAHARALGAVASGPWGANTNVGRAAADPLTRAVTAKLGLLALSSAETLYFTAFEDSAGAPLTDSCTYRMTGRDLPARWWSITLYAADSYLARNGLEAHSVSQDSVTREPDGSFEIAITPERPEGAANWIADAKAGAFSLTARLYNPDPTVADTPAAAPMPAIERVDCVAPPTDDGGPAP